MQYLKSVSPNSLSFKAIVFGKLLPRCPPILVHRKLAIWGFDYRNPLDLENRGDG